MNKAIFSAAAFFTLAACAYKLPEAQVLRIFERHSFKEHDAEELRALIRGSGLAGLKFADRYAAVARAGRQAKTAVKPGPSAGMLVGVNGGDYFLLRVFRGSPAEAAGLKDGDKLLAVNSAAPGSEGFFAALSGKPEFKLKIARSSGVVRELETGIKAGQFSLPPVFGFYEPETRAAFVRIGLFFEGSAAVAAAGLAGLERYGAKSVIFDLRGNKGGDPEEAAALLKLFASKPEPVLAIGSRHRGYTHVFEAAARGCFAGMKVIVLADPATSMAGEVFAASLKEMTGAAVIGGRTAGNVSIQKTFSLDKAHGLRLTVARLTPPSGNDLEGAGLAPDEPVAAAGGAWSADQAGALLRDPVYLRALELSSKAR